MTQYDNDQQDTDLQQETSNQQQIGEDEDEDGIYGPIPISKLEVSSFMTLLVSETKDLILTPFTYRVMASPLVISENL